MLLLLFMEVGTYHSMFIPMIGYYNSFIEKIGILNHVQASLFLVFLFYFSTFSVQAVSPLQPQMVLSLLVSFSLQVLASSKQQTSSLLLPCFCFVYDVPAQRREEFPRNQFEIRDDGELSAVLHR